MLTIEAAIALATEAHRGQVDRAGEPYILHPLRVMLALRTPDERIAGVLHDVVEDTVRNIPSRRITIERLRDLGCSAVVLAGLDLLTRRDDETYEEFIARLAPDPLARRVKLADLADNLDVTRLRQVSARDVELLNRYLRARETLLALV